MAETPEGIVKSTLGRSEPTEEAQWKAIQASTWGYGGAYGGLHTRREQWVYVGEGGWLFKDDLVGKGWYPASANPATTDVFAFTTEKLKLSESSMPILDLLSEGPIEGPCSGEYIFSGNLGQIGWSTAVWSGFKAPSIDGLHSGSYLRSVYWNQMPVIADDGTSNFAFVKNAEWTPGLVNGTTASSMLLESSSVRSVGDRLYYQVPRYYRILDKNCTSVQVNFQIAQLMATVPSNGDIIRNRITVNVSYRPIFANRESKWSTPEEVFYVGKITLSPFVDSKLINFDLTQFLSMTQIALDQPFDPYGPTRSDQQQALDSFLQDVNFQGWEIKVEKISSDSVTVLRADTIYVESLQENYQNILKYPCSALITTTFDAKYFNSVPDRAYDCNLLKVQIPGNYDPILRRYASNGFATTNGFWNGTFATGKAWTNNPAWCYYDMVTNKRYGLGKYLQDLEVDKFNLYRIAQYCDELVPDGYGGLEPRFTCNAWITSRDEAYKVINNLASIFNAISYYAYGNLYVTQDSPKSPRVIFTNANVEDGNFNYSSSSRRARQSVAIVRYNDKKDFYKPAVEYVENFDSIRKYGIREIDLTAFGCTSRGQAIRMGNWALLSNNTETETVQFVAGLEATSLRNGDIFKVNDQFRKGKRYAGRIRSIDNTNKTVVLDGTCFLETGIQYMLSVVTPSFYYDPVQVSGLTDSDYPNIRRAFLQNRTFSGDNCYISGNYSILTLDQAFNTTNYVISGYPTYSIELGPNSLNYTGMQYFTDSDYDYYRVINIKETDANKYEVVGLQYNGDKFNQIISGISYKTSNDITQSSSKPASPHDLVLNPETSDGTTVTSVQYAFLIDDFTNVTNYNVYVSTGDLGVTVPDNTFLYTSLPSDVNQGFYPVTNNEAQTLYFSVWAYNSRQNLYSDIPATANITLNVESAIKSVVISSLDTIG